MDFLFAFVAAVIVAYLMNAGGNGVALPVVAAVVTFAVARVLRRSNAALEDARARSDALEAKARQLGNTVAILSTRVATVERDSSALRASLDVTRSRDVPVMPAPPAAVHVPAAPSVPEAERVVRHPAEQALPPPAQLLLTRVTSAGPGPRPDVPHADGGSMFGFVKAALDLEERLGTNWLNKLGVFVLVMGVAFFLSYELRELGPAGKVVVGYIVGSVLLAGGVVLERRHQYRIPARALIAGGWALIFFTTYAMFNVPAARVLSSETVDLLLLFVVASAMVGHSLRYRSQVVTGLSFLLAFATVAISHVSVFSLSAGVLLALALVVIVDRLQWYEMELGGVAATYLNHYLWVRPIIEAQGTHRGLFPEFWASVAMLVSYWAIFRASYLVRRIDSRYHERLSTTAALLNSILLGALLRYQAARPELAFWGLLGLGAAEIVLARLAVRRQRRPAFVVLSTIGATLLVAAFAYRYSGARLSVIWLLEAEALLLAGVLTREVVFRRLGITTAMVVAAQMIAFDAAPIVGVRMDGARVVNEFGVGLIFAVAAVLFYLNAHVIPRRWPDLFEHWLDLLLARRLSYVAGVMALVGAYTAWPEAWTAVAWSALALGLVTVATRVDPQELKVQANVLAASACLRALVINMTVSRTVQHVSMRAITIALVASCVYAFSRRSDIQPFSAPRQFPAIYCWVASALLGLVAWYELQPASVALAWALGGLALVEIGVLRGTAYVRLQGYVALVLSFTRVFFVNLNAAGTNGTLGPRIYTVVPLVVAYFYVYASLNGRAEAVRLWPRADGTVPMLRPGPVYAWLGTIATVALLRFELAPDRVVIGWALLTLALALSAWMSGRRIFLHQAILLAVALLGRGAFHNLYERSYFPATFWYGPVFSLSVASAVLFASLIAAFHLRVVDRDPAAPGRWAVLRALDRRPEQTLFFVPLGLVTLLLAVEMPGGTMTAGWGVEAVIVFLFALWVRERSFRLAGVGLLLLAVGRIGLFDVWHLSQRDRYLTFIVLGSSLLAVSFLYTRYRELLREYL
jgi:uncharacterized membrane protein